MRRRYVQIDGELHEVGGDLPISTDARNYIVGDRHYSGLCAPDANRSDISTRAKHRAYMKRNNLTTVDDFQGEWQRAAQKRAEYFQGVDKERKQQVEEAYHKRR